MSEIKPLSDRQAAAIAHNARWGLIFFAIYVALYVGFMVLAAFFPEKMAEPTSIASVNLAIVYGMGLIVAALVLAMVYLFVSQSPESPG
jgi:uncharacterized membrane protein (DUF485 family)